MRTIQITGKGQIKVKPDMTRITLSLEGTRPEYGETLRKSSEDTERLKDLLMTFGFERTGLKTLNFSVDTKYESYKYKDTYKRRFVGYRFQHMMKLEFESDNNRLGKILYALANCPEKPEFYLSYTVKDTETAKNELLKKAVADAKEKAFVLTHAAGVTLKDIQSIDYSWSQINFEFKPMNRMLMPGISCDSMAGSENYDMAIEPDDVEVSDTVTALWEID